MIKTLFSNIHVLLLLVIGFVLRFTISFTHSYSSDELSAINRLNINGFNNIIENAVKTGDMHPAGVQFFEEFWVTLFGNSELILRLPFVLMGVLSIWLIYLIGKTYLSKNTGIIAATLLSITYFPIIHSELARPYSPGLLFSLMTAWFWLKLVKTESKNWTTIVGLGISFALAMYTHYFAFMFVGFIGLTGFIFIKKTTLVPYLISGVIAILLFLPHLNITIYHLSIDGGLQWLAKPEKTWLLKFIFHALNDSWLFTLTLFAVTIFVVYKSKFNLRNSKPTNTIFAIWFFGIFIIGYLFSYFSSPILKFPVMLFPLPFLFLVIGNFYSKATLKLTTILFSIILLVGTSSTIIEKKLYGNEHFGVFKELAEPIVKWRTELGKENISTYFNLSNPNYLNYYVTQLGDSLEFNQHLIEFNDENKIRKELEQLTTDYLVIGYSQRLTLPQIFETCKTYYPVIIDYVKLNNCAVFLLAKKGKSISTHKVQLISEFTPKLNTNLDWKYETNQIKSTYYLSDSTHIYGPSYTFKTSALNIYHPYYLKVKTTALATTESEITITLTAYRNGKEVKNKSGENIWIGKDLEEDLYDSKIKTAYFTTAIPDEIKTTDDIQISLWNRNGSPIQVESISIEVVENIWN